MSHELRTPPSSNIGYATRLRQISFNLFSNVFKFSENGTIAIELLVDEIGTLVRREP